MNPSTRPLKLAPTSDVAGSETTADAFEIGEAAREWNLAVIEYLWPQAVLDPKYSCHTIATSPRTISEPPSNERSHVQRKQNLLNIVSRLVPWGRRS